MISVKTKDGLTYFRFIKIQNLQKMLQPSNLFIINVQFCKSCSTHNWCTHHDEQKYLNTYQKLKNYLEQHFPTDLFVQGNVISDDLLPIKPAQNKYFNTKANKYVTFPSIGAFQVMLDSQLIFSKKTTNTWPNFAQIAQLIHLKIHGQSRSKSPNRKHNTMKNMNPKNQMTDVDIKTQKDHISIKNQSFLDHTDKRSTFYKNRSPNQHKNFTLTDHFKNYHNGNYKTPMKFSNHVSDEYFTTANTDNENQCSQMSSFRNGNSSEKEFLEFKKSFDAFGLEGKLPEFFQKKGLMKENSGKKQMIIRLDSIEEESVLVDENNQINLANTHTTFKSKSKEKHKRLIKRFTDEFEQLQAKFKHFEQRVETIREQNKKFDERDSSPKLNERIVKELTDLKKKEKRLRSSQMKQSAQEQVQEQQMMENPIIFARRKLKNIDDYINGTEEEKNQKLKKIYGEWKLMKKPYKGRDYISPYKREVTKRTGKTNNQKPKHLAQNEGQLSSSSSSENLPQHQSKPKIPKHKLPKMNGLKQSKSNQVLTQEKFYSTTRDQFHDFASRKFNSKPSQHKFDSFSNNSAEKHLNRPQAGVKLNTFGHVSQKETSEFNSDHITDKYPHTFVDNKNKIKSKGNLLKSIPKKKEKQQFLTKQSSSRQMSRSSRKIHINQMTEPYLNYGQKVDNSASVQNSFNSQSKQIKSFKHIKKSDPISKSAQKYSKNINKNQNSHHSSDDSEDLASDQESQTENFENSHQNAQSLQNNFFASSLPKSQSKKVNREKKTDQESVDSKKKSVRNSGAQSFLESKLSSQNQVISSNQHKIKKKSKIQRNNQITKNHKSLKIHSQMKQNELYDNQNKESEQDLYQAETAREHKETKKKLKNEKRKSNQLYLGSDETIRLNKQGVNKQGKAQKSEKNKVHQEKNEISSEEEEEMAKTLIQRKSSFNEERLEEESEVQSDVYSENDQDKPVQKNDRAVQNKQQSQKRVKKSKKSQLESRDLKKIQQHKVIQAQIKNSEKKFTSKNVDNSQSSNEGDKYSQEESDMKYQAGQDLESSQIINGSEKAQNQQKMQKKMNEENKSSIRGPKTKKLKPKQSSLKVQKHQQMNIADGESQAQEKNLDEKEDELLNENSSKVLKAKMKQPVRKNSQKKSNMSSKFDEKVSSESSEQAQVQSCNEEAVEKDVSKKIKQKAIKSLNKKSLVKSLSKSQIQQEQSSQNEDLNEDRKLQQVLNSRTNQAGAQKQKPSKNKTKNSAQSKVQSNLSQTQNNDENSQQFSHQSFHQQKDVQESAASASAQVKQKRLKQKAKAENASKISRQSKLQQDRSQFGQNQRIESSENQSESEEAEEFNRQEQVLPTESSNNQITLKSHENAEMEQQTKTNSKKNHKQPKNKIAKSKETTLDQKHQQNIASSNAQIITSKSPNVKSSQKQNPKKIQEEQQKLDNSQSQAEKEKESEIQAEECSRDQENEPQQEEQQNVKDYKNKKLSEGSNKQLPQYKQKVKKIKQTEGEKGKSRKHQEKMIDSSASKKIQKENHQSSEEVEIQPSQSRSSHSSKVSSDSQRQSEQTQTDKKKQSIKEPASKSPTGHQYNINNKSETKSSQKSKKSKKPLKPSSEQIGPQDAQKAEQSEEIQKSESEVLQDESVSESPIDRKSETIVNEAEQKSLTQKKNKKKVLKNHSEQVDESKVTQNQNNFNQVQGESEIEKNQSHQGSIEKKNNQFHSDDKMKASRQEEQANESNEKLEVDDINQQKMEEQRIASTTRSTRNKILNVYETDRGKEEGQDSLQEEDGQNQDVCDSEDKKAFQKENTGIQRQSRCAKKVEERQNEEKSTDDNIKNTGEDTNQKQMGREKIQLERSFVVKENSRMNEVSHAKEQLSDENKKEENEVHADNAEKQQNPQCKETASQIQGYLPTQSRHSSQSRSVPQAQLSKTVAERSQFTKLIRAPITTQFYGQSFQQELQFYPTHVISTEQNIAINQIPANSRMSLFPSSLKSSQMQLFNPKSIQVQKMYSYKPLPNLVKCIKILSEINQFLIVRLFENPSLSFNQATLSKLSFGVWLCLHGQWRCIVVNLQQVLLCLDSQNFYYLNHHGNQLWPMVLEKALVQGLEGYGTLSSLPCHKLFNILTGSNSLFFNIKQDPSKNGRILRYINDCENKNFVLHAQKVCKNLEQLQNKDKQARIYYVISQRTVYENEILLQVRDSSKNESQWIKLQKFVQQFKSIQILQLRINHNFSSISLGKPSSNQNMTIVSLEFERESFGSITLSTEPYQGSLLRTYLYREQKSNYLKLVGQAQQKNKSTLFFDCCFSGGKYWLFVECGSDARVTYLGENQPQMQVVEEVKGDGLKNGWTEYLPVRTQENVRGKEQKQNIASREGFKMPNKLIGKFNQTGMSFRSEQDKISRLRENFIDYLLRQKK